MNTTIEREPSRSLAAAAALGLLADADSNAARSRFLEKLADENFLPPGRWLAALSRLGQEVPLMADAAAHHEAFERADLDAFLAEFWTLDSLARRTRWEELQARCQSPRILARLKALNDGLTVGVTSFADADEEEIAGVIRGCFLLPPRARAVRRAEWAAAHRDAPLWKAAAARFRAADAATAALEPLLLDGLERPPTVKPASDGSPAPLIARRARKRPQRQPEPFREEPLIVLANRNYRWLNIWWIGLLICIVLIVCVMLMNASAPPRPPNPEVPVTPPQAAPQPFEMPKRTPAPRPDLSKMYTPEQIKEFEEYDPRTFKPEPRGYRTWLLLRGNQPQPADAEAP